ncbi:MAG: HD domain-containing protein [Treponema sp.]|nr:HD domain-containing protein [Treponema sp.]
MSQQIINAANIALDAYSVIISIIIAGSIYLFKKVNKSAKWFAYTNIVAVIYGIADIIMWISEGTDAKWKLIALPLSSFVFFLFGIFIFFCYIMYIISYYRHTAEIGKSYVISCLVAVCLYIVFLVITLFTDCYYTISPQNTYSRGKYFILTVLIEIFLYCEALFLILKYHKNVMGFENIGFASFIFVPFICHIVQLANFGISLTSFGLSISFLIIFINLNQKMMLDIESTKIQYNENKLKSLELHKKTILYLTNLLENRDIETANHELRISNYVELLARQCVKRGVYSEKLTDDYIQKLKDAAPFHDIGKIYISDAILKKPAKVDDKEYLEIQKHAQDGATIVNEIISISYERDFTKMVSKMCKHHHEKWNGKGYPDHLREEEIPLCARLTAIADVYDALVTKRCYKNKVSYDQAFEIIRKEGGESFDPKLTEQFLEIKDQIIEITEKYNDNSIEGL